jgi:simple sugar transport system ATP-binding protein
MTESNLLPSGKPRIDSLELRGITKRFPGVLANDRVDFDVKAGEVMLCWAKTAQAKAR